MPAHLVLNPVALDAVLRGPGGPVAMMLVERASRVQDAAKAQITAGKAMHGNDSSDALALAIVKRWITTTDAGLGMLVGTDTVFYARWVHDGNGPEGGRIFPNPPTDTSGRARHLRFEIGGAVFYRTSVATSKPNRFLTDNLHFAL